MVNTLTGDGGYIPATPGAGQGNAPNSGAPATPLPGDSNAGGQAIGLVTERAVLARWVIDALQRMRNFRRPYDQRRSYFYRQYIGQRDRRLYPDNLTPRSNTFVPYPRSNVEALVSRVHDAFFGVDPPIEARKRGGTAESSDNMQAVMLYGLHKAKWVQQIELIVRDCGIYGHCGIKVDWDWDYDEVTGPEPVYAQQPVVDPLSGQPVLGLDGQPQMALVLNPQTGEPIQIGTKMVTKTVPRACPKLIPVDIYDLLIDPDGKQVALVTEISWGELRRQAEAKPDLYFPEAIGEIQHRISQYREEDQETVIIRIAELWDDTKKTVTQVSFGEDADAIGWKDRRYQYRNASYSAYKRRVYNGPPVMLYTGPNPFIHKRIPILHTAYIPLKGDIYGIGIVETISDLSEGVNVFTNMITDNWNLGINRRFAYDVQVDIDHDQLDMGNVPGGKVGVVGDPSRAIFPLPSFTPNPGDYMIIDLYRGMIETASGISDFYAKGIGSPVGNRTSSGIGQVINEGGYIFKLFIRRFELEILQPLVEMVASMIQQFGTDPMEYSLTSAPPTIPKYGKVPLEQLTGQYDFDFVAANYATGKVVKQRNLMAFYNLAMQSPYARQGDFLREIARALEVPYANRLLKTEQQVQQESAQAQQTQQQLILMEKLIDMESKALVAEVSKKEPNAVTDHALGVQQVVEDFLAETAGVPVETPVQAVSTPEGRPRMSQFEGEIPGGDVGDQMRGFSQAMGSNALGISGMEQ